jgi:hypothetical protein
MDAKAYWWAYAVKDGKAVIVRCNTMRDAVEEKERLKQSDAKEVGNTLCKLNQTAMERYCKRSGWKVLVVRDFQGVIGHDPNGAARHSQEGEAERPVRRL